MNLLLLATAEVEGGRARIVGARAEHVARVLKKSVGDELKVGVVGQGRALARVAALDAEGLAIELGELEPVPSPRVQLIVALPRPKALSRLLQTAASFGVARLDLVGGYRVDKSYFDSPRLAAERLREDLWLGCEQGAQVWLPEARVTASFRQFVEEVLPARQASEPCRDVLLHPGATRSLAVGAPTSKTATRLALGPEGGWTTGELACFERAGFEGITLGPPILKTEAALAATLGQLLLLDAQLDS